MTQKPPLATFTIVPRPAPAPPKSRSRRWVAVLLALSAVAGVAAASALTVGLREEAAAVFAERVEIGDRFAFVDATISAVPADVGALGTLASPIELTPQMPPARTALLRDHWAYTVTIRESSASAVGGGTYVVSVFLDGVALGTVHASQAAADASVTEGIRATFDVGTALQSSSLYYITVEALPESLPTAAFTVRSNPNGNLTWLGVGGDVDGVVNPTLQVAAGTILHLTGRNADGGTHNVGIRDAGNAVVDPPGWTVNIPAGEDRTASWTATAGTYSYQCQYHPTMRGTLVVST